MATGNRPKHPFLLVLIITKFTFGGKMSLLLGEDVKGLNPLNQLVPPWLALCTRLSDTEQAHSHPPPVFSHRSWEGLGQELKSTASFL